MVVLIDNQTQSSAEVMAGALKKSKLAFVVGSPSRGWGSVERVFDLQNQIDSGQHYSVFLVHTLTLDDKNQPIEGRGIQPDVNISAANWPNNLENISNSPSLVTAIKKILE